MGVGPGGRNCGTGRGNDRAAEAGSWLAVTSRRSKGGMAIAGGDPRTSPSRVSGARGPRKQSPRRGTIPAGIGRYRFFVFFPFPPFFGMSCPVGAGTTSGPTPRRVRVGFRTACGEPPIPAASRTPRGRSRLLRHFLTVRVATSPRVERVADRLLEFLVALTGRKVLGGGLGTSAKGASGNGLDAPGDRLRMERVTHRGRDSRGHRRVLPSRIVTRTKPSKAPTARASDSNRPNWVARSFGITVLPASEWQLRDEPGDPPVNQT
jgi:hypothetical protein